MTHMMWIIFWTLAITGWIFTIFLAVSVMLDWNAGRISQREAIKRCLIALLTIIPIVGPIYSIYFLYTIVFHNRFKKT